MAVNKLKLYDTNRYSGNTEYLQAMRNYRNSRHSYSRFESEEVVSRSSSGMSILGIVFFILLLGLLIRTLQGSYNVPTFTGLLKTLSEIQRPEIPFINIASINLGNWGLFNFLRDFFLILLDVVNVAIFLCNGILVLMQYVSIFFRWLFFS